MTLNARTLSGALSDANFLCLFIDIFLMINVNKVYINDDHQYFFCFLFITMFRNVKEIKTFLTLCVIMISSYRNSTSNTTA